MKGPGCHFEEVSCSLYGDDGKPLRKDAKRFKAHGIIRKNQMFSVPSFSLIISGGGKTHFGSSKRPFCDVTWISVWTLCLSCAVETYMKGFCRKTPSMDFRTLLVIN